MPAKVRAATELSCRERSVCSHVLFKMFEAIVLVLVLTLTFRVALRNIPGTWYSHSVNSVHSSIHFQLERWHHILCAYSYYFYQFHPVQSTRYIRSRPNNAHYIPGIYYSLPVQHTTYDSTYLVLELYYDLMTCIYL